jgi:hypothetical protein
MSGKEFIAEFLHPQISRPLGQVFALAGDTWPERVIAADLLHEELGAGGVHFVAEASHPIRMHRARAARRAHVRAAVGLTVIWSVALLSRQLPPFWPVLLRVIILVGLPTADGMPALLLDRLQRRLVTSGQASRRIFSPSDDPEAVELTALEKPLDEAGQEAIRMEMARSAGDLTAVVMQAARWAVAIAAVLKISSMAHNSNERMTTTSNAQPTGHRSPARIAVDISTKSVCARALLHRPRLFQPPPHNPFDLNFAFVLVGLRQVVGHLQPQRFALSLALP